MNETRQDLLDRIQMHLQEFLPEKPVLNIPSKKYCTSALIANANVYALNA